MSFLNLEKYLKHCVQDEKIPGWVCWLGTKKQTLFFESYGYAQTYLRRIDINKSTLFDLASLTKPFVTALMTIKLIEEKKLKLTDRLVKFIPEFKKKPIGGKTIKQVLTHTAGIPAWFPLYLIPAEKRFTHLAAMELGGNSVVYSCLGYIILGKIIEHITGSRLDLYYREAIVKKLSLKNTGFNPKNRRNVAATELGNNYEKNLASKYGRVTVIKWRNYLIKGEVHDGNSFYAFKGVSGNAGLFSTALEIVKFIRAYLNGELISLRGVKSMTRVHTRGKEGRGLGWVVGSYPGIPSSRVFYHTGFTGTMCCVEPKKELIIILLANAVHPFVKPEIMAPIRREVVQYAIREYHG